MTTQSTTPKSDFWQQDMVIVPLMVQMPAEYAKSCIWAATVPEELWVVGAQWHIMLGQLLTLIHATQDKVAMSQEYYERLAGLLPWPEPETE
jgi:hypothetical protein